MTDFRIFTQLVSRRFAALATLTFVSLILTAGCARNHEPAASEPASALAEAVAPPTVAAPAPVITDPPVAATVEDPADAPRIAARSVEPEPDRRAEELAARERELARREAEVAAREAAEQAAAAAAEVRVAQAMPEPAPQGEPVAEVELAPSSPLPEVTPEPALPEEVRVPATLVAGTHLEVEFVVPLSSATASVGDTFRTRVAKDLYDDRGVLTVPAGSEVVGSVREVQALRRVGGRARLGLDFTDLVLPGGETAPIHASFSQQGRSETGRDAATIGGAAAGGAILGRILERGSKRNGTVIGALLGAAAGTLLAARSDGEEIEIPIGTAVDLQLERALTLDVLQVR